MIEQAASELRAMGARKESRTLLKAMDEGRKIDKAAVARLLAFQGLLYGRNEMTPGNGTDRDPGAHSVKITPEGWIQARYQQATLLFQEDGMRYRLRNEAWASALSAAEAHEDILNECLSRGEESPF